MQAVTVSATVDEDDREVVGWWKSLKAEVLGGSAVLDLAVILRMPTPPPLPSASPCQLCAQ
jgi:hypothetical protein